MRLKLFFVSLIFLCIQNAYCQTKDSTVAMEFTALQNYNNLSSKTLGSIDKKYTTLTTDVTAKSAKLLSNMQKQETSLTQKMWGIDSNKAKEIFAGAQSKYQQLASKLSSATNPSILHPLKEYIPGLDSMQTAMSFMQNANTKLPGILSSSKLQQIQTITSQTQELEGKLQSANEIQDYVRARSQALKDQLTQFGLGKQLLGMNKQVFYYQQQLTAYKAMLNDKNAIEQKAFTAIEKLPAFQNFMARNSYFSQLFRVRGNEGVGSVITTPGLQTKAQLQAIISKQFGTAASAINPQQILQQASGPTGQNVFDQLKAKVNSMGGESSDMAMPDFKPNDQKTKSFLKRIEYGISIQSDKGRSFLPATSNIALITGYKLSDKATIGTGLSYLLGWGTGLSHISFTNQGIGVRSFVDIKAKGNIWVTGGYEYSYYQQFASIHDIEHLDISAWQKSALFGLTKKYKVGKKNCSMQLLYDFLYRDEVPNGTPFKFRLGYSL